MINEENSEMVNYCINPQCKRPINPEDKDCCQSCGTSLLINERYRLLKPLRPLEEQYDYDLYEVEDEEDLEKLKVLKVLKSEDEKTVQLFKQESAILRLWKHKGIPKADNDFTLVPNQSSRKLHCFVMELIEGRDLKKWLEQENRLRQGIDWLKQLVEILKYVHGKNWFHRDIKPSNIILRPNGELVLIDFGTARDITTTYAEKHSNKDVTLVLSEGYTAPEQEKGQGTKESDLFALGRTFVHLLTGEYPDGNPGWRDRSIPIDDWFADLIDDLMNPVPSKRPNIKDILERLEQKEKWNNPRRKILPMVAASLIMTGLVMGVRYLGFLQIWELKTYDAMVRLRSEEGVDSRLLVVEATEEDVNSYGFPLPDGILAQTIEKIDEYEPRVIGLNIFRDKPREPGNDQLRKLFQEQNHLIPVCSIGVQGNENNPGIKPPAGVPKDRVGFSDVRVDRDGILRRQILFMHSDYKESCDTNSSFAFSTALPYLKEDNIQPKTVDNDWIKLGKADFKRLQANTGPYQGLDNGGFQIMLDYRTKKVAQRVTVAQVLSGEVNPDLIKDKIVLIGVTAPISTDYLPTPYSAGEDYNPGMSGVMIKAHMVSQILDAAFGGRPLLQFWKDWQEGLFIFGSSLIGGVMVLIFRGKKYWLPFATGLAIIMIAGFSRNMLILGTWVPLVPSVWALTATAFIVFIFVCKL